MKKFIDLIIKLRWIIAIAIPIITILFALQFKHIQFDGSYRIWFGENSQTLKQYDEFRDIFGNDDAIIIVFHDENGVLNKKALGVIDRLTEKLWQTKYIARVDSLTNYQYIHTDKEYPDDILVENFIEDYSSLSPQQLKEKEKIALKETMIVGKIISKDAKTTMIVGRLVPKASTTIGSSKFIKNAVDGYLAEEKKSGYKFYLAGGPVVNQTFSSLAKYDMTTFTPLVILMVMLLLWLVFKRASGMLLSISIVIFTFIIVLATQVLLGYKLNNFTANMPVFIIAIGIADATHLFWIYLLARKDGLENYAAIHYSVEKNFLPILLTSLTTAVGFASLGISEIVPIKTLGIATANAALLAFILTILFIPALLAILNPKITKNDAKNKDEISSSLATKYATFIIKNDTKIIFTSIAVFGFISLGLFKLQVDSNSIRYFREEVPFRSAVTFIQNNLTGPMAYEIVIDSKAKDGIKSPAFMKEVEKFEKELKAKFPDARHTSSLIDVVKRFNEIMVGKNEVPASNEIIAQYLLLYSLSLPQGMEINDRMDIDERLLRLTASMDVVNTSLDLKMIKWIENWWKNSPYSAQVNGQTTMFAHMQSDITDTLIQSITLAISVVSLMMLFIFRKIKMIPLFIIPNILPIVLVLGVMGWLGITIDIGVAISGAIIIGVAVDDTIHFLVKYKEARLKGYNFHDSLTYIMKYAGSAIIFTTVILSTSFLIFRFSDFMLNVNFGIVTAIALIIAVLVDLFMLPAILSKFDGKEKSFLN